MVLSEVKAKYMKELKRSSKALNETRAKLKSIKESRIGNPNSTETIGRLEYACYVGGIYVQKLEEKVKSL